MFKELKNNKGFTILELAIAVGVMLAVFSAIGGFINRVIPDFMLISLLNEESQYARSITQLLARDINKAHTGLPKSFLLLRQNKKPVLEGKGETIAPVMILSGNNNDTPQATGRRIWIASEQDPKITNRSSAYDDGDDDKDKGTQWIKETAEQDGKIYSINNEGLLVYQTAKRTVDYELKISDDEISIFPNKGKNFFVVDNKYTVALPGTKKQVTALNFIRNKPRDIDDDDPSEILDEVYTMELIMNTTTTYDREYKYSTKIAAGVNPLMTRARIASGKPLT